MGSAKKKKNQNLYTQHSSNFFPLDGSFPNQEFCPDEVQMLPPRGPKRPLCRAHVGQLSPSARDQSCQETSDGGGRSCTRHVLIHVREILLAGVQQPLRAEVKEAEEPASPSKGTSANRAAAAPEPPGSPPPVAEPQPSAALPSTQQSLHQRHLTWETDMGFRSAGGTQVVLLLRRRHIKAHSTALFPSYILI